MPGAACFALQHRRRRVFSFQKRDGGMFAFAGDDFFGYMKGNALYTTDRDEICRRKPDDPVANGNVKVKGLILKEAARVFTVGRLAVGHYRKLTREGVEYLKNC